MGKRTIQECDLTKQEYDPDETFIITIKKKGKAKGRSYDLSPEAATKLEQQLVAGADAALESNWSFGSQPQRRPREEIVDDYGVIEDDVQDDTKFVAAKKAELKDEGVIDSEPREVVNSVFKDDGDCPHMNRGRPQMTIRDGERYAYTICKDCRKQLPMKKRDEKASYHSAKPPADVRVRDLE